MIAGWKTLTDSKGKKQNDLKQLSVPEDPAGGRAYQYVSTVIWVATYIKTRAAMGGITEEQLIAQFEHNVRKCMDTDWKEH